MIEQAGLVTSHGHPVPLCGVDVRGEVVGGHVRLAITQRYVNREARPIEAVYVFPLSPTATLSGFAMTAGGRRLEGIVKEREETSAPTTTRSPPGTARRSSTRSGPTSSPPRSATSCRARRPSWSSSSSSGCRPTRACSAS